MPNFEELDAKIVIQNFALQKKSQSARTKDEDRSFVADRLLT